MQFKSLSIPDVFLLEPTIHNDSRGYFFESFKQSEFNEAIKNEILFAQDNHSKSMKGVLRGLHYQLPPKSQGKLVRVISGEIFDVAVDLRKSSQTFGMWVGNILTSENKRQVWIPEGFAHGFLTLSESAEVIYKTTDVYSPKNEHCLKWNDAKIAIQWPDISKIIISSKDQLGKPLDQSELFN